MADTSRRGFDRLYLHRLVRIAPAPDNRLSFPVEPFMFGRLFKFFVLCTVLYAVARWLLNRRQKETLRELFQTLAQALLISSLIFVGLYLAGFHRL